MGVPTAWSPPTVSMMLSGCSLSPARMRLLICPNKSSSSCRFLNWCLACYSLIWVGLWSAALTLPRSMVSTWYFSCRDLKRLAYLKTSGVVSTPWMSCPSQMAPPRKSNFLLEVTLFFSLEIMVLLQQIDYTPIKYNPISLLSLIFHTANIHPFYQLCIHLADIR